MILGKLKLVPIPINPWFLMPNPKQVTFQTTTAISVSMLHQQKFNELGNHWKIWIPVLKRNKLQSRDYSHTEVIPGFFPPFMTPEYCVENVSSLYGKYISLADWLHDFCKCPWGLMVKCQVSRSANELLRNGALRFIMSNCRTERSTFK